MNLTKEPYAGTVTHGPLNTPWDDDVKHPINKHVDTAMAILLGNMTLLSILFNFKTFYEFAKKLRMGKTNPSFYIYFHLLGSDLILCCVCAPFSVFAHAMARSAAVDRLLHTSKSFLVYCNVSGFLYNVVSKTSVQLILLLTFDRWLTIVHPRTHRHWVSISRYRVVIIILWVASILASCSPFFNSKLYAFQHKFISLCTWDFSMLGIKHRDKALHLFVYFAYVILPIVFPLLLTIAFAVVVIKRLHSIKRRDYRRNKKTSKVSYAATTVTLVTIFHIFSYAIWHFVIASSLLSLMGLLPQLTMDSALKNHIFTSYPIGAYLNAAVNPILLYFRIVKRNLATKAKRVAVSSKAVSERKVVQVVEDKVQVEENVAVVHVLDIPSSERPAQISFVTRVIGRMNSAHKLIKRSLTWHPSKAASVINNMNKEIVVFRESGEKVTNNRDRRESLIKSLTVHTLKPTRAKTVVETASNFKLPGSAHSFPSREHDELVLANMNSSVHSLKEDREEATDYCMQTVSFTPQMSHTSQKLSVPTVLDKVAVTNVVSETSSTGDQHAIVFAQPIKINSAEITNVTIVE